jgi:hypothetical protein
MRVWRTFKQSRAVRMVCFTIAAALLVASVAGLVLSAPTPGEVPAANYEHRGHFDYTVYLKPSVLYGDIVFGEEEEQEQVPMVFFRDIIAEMKLAFSYDFDANQPLSAVTSDVVISIIAENPDVWQKQMTQLEETHGGSEFSTEFPLSLASLEKIVADIEAEIGVSTPQRNFIIRAEVTTTAETALNTTVEHMFRYDLPATLTAKKLELTGDLESSKVAYRDGIRFDAKGRFDYEVSLKPNKLYETEVLRSGTLPPPEPPAHVQTLGPGLMYFPKLISDIAARFSYRFTCEAPISEQSHEVEVTATIENPGMWSRTMVLMPRTQKADSFVTSFPIDLEYITRIIDAIGEETGVRGTTHNIVLEADVHTIAGTGAGTVDEIYTQTLTATMEGNTLTFGSELSGSRTGTIGGTGTPGAPQEARPRTPWIIMLVIALVALGYFGWSQSRLGLAAISAGEAEVRRAAKRYRQMMVDVAALPEVKPGDTVVPLGSVDDLVRIGDDLARPVLHHAEEGHHSYCVIDGTVRYLYAVRA